MSVSIILHPPLAIVNLVFLKTTLMQYYIQWDFFNDVVVKNLPEMQEMHVRSLGWEDPLKEEAATHSSVLAWKVPWREEPGGPSPKMWLRDRYNWVLLMIYNETHPFRWIVLMHFHRCIQPSNWHHSKDTEHLDHPQKLKTHLPLQTSIPFSQL